MRFHICNQVEMAQYRMLKPNQLTQEMGDLVYFLEYGLSRTYIQTGDNIRMKPHVRGFDSLQQFLRCEKVIYRLKPNKHNFY